jgi:hypothetical protein
MGRIKSNTYEWIGVATCNMVLMVINADSYDVFLGLDFLIKIGAIVDLERKLIQVKQGPGTNVHVLPLNMVNMLQLVLEPPIQSNDILHKLIPRIFQLSLNFVVEEKSCSMGWEIQMN